MYLRVDDVSESIKQLGVGSLLIKMDLKVRIDTYLFIQMIITCLGFHSKVIHSFAFWATIHPKDFFCSSSCNDMGTS